MTGSWGSALATEIDPFRTAVAFAVLSGALSLVVPWLAALTAALAALALASWFGTHRRRNPRGRGCPVALGLAGLTVAFGAVTFVALPDPWATGRGLALGASLLPLWWIDRRSAAGGALPGSSG